MRTFYLFCLRLRRLHWGHRLLIVLLYFLLFEVLTAYMTTLHRERGFASLLIGAGVLSALAFPWKRALALEWGLLWVYLAINISIKGLCPDQIAAFLSGTFLDFFIIATIGFLRMAWEKEEKLALLKDQFIMNVNHELRSPLTCALGSLDILKESDDSLSNEEREMFLDQAVYACAELQRIADNILDAVRCESDVSPPWVRRFDAGRVVADVLRRIDAIEHPIHIDIRDEVMVTGDSQQVGQVVRNLLSNCFKYAPKGTPVFVRVWQDDEFAYVCIQDMGPGIAPEHIPLIFQKFSRLEHDIAGPVRGIGLGLYICRRFIENMGGRIWVDSAGISGEGSRFYFTVPCTKNIQQDVHTQRKRVPSSVPGSLP